MRKVDFISIVMCNLLHMIDTTWIFLVTNSNFKYINTKPTVIWVHINAELILEMTAFGTFQRL